MISDTFRLLTLEFLGPEETVVLSLENYSNIYERALPFGLLIYLFIRVCLYASGKHLRTKVTPDFRLTYSKNGGTLGLVLK